MSLAGLGMDYTDSFMEGDGILEYVEHLRDGSMTEYQLENVFPFTSIADIKRMIWQQVEGSVDYTPKFVFLAIEKEGSFWPLEFHWPTESTIPASLADPLKNQEISPVLVDPAGNRSGVAATLHLYANLEDCLRPHALEKPILHIWRLSEIVGETATMDARKFDGFVRLYFPWLSEISVLEEAFQTEENSTTEVKEAYKTCETYITARQEQLVRIQADLAENASAMGDLSCRAIEKIKIGLAPITPKPESLEILFYELKLSASLPFLRYFSERGDQEPIMRYLKNIYLPQEAVATWLKEPMTKKEQLIKGKVLIRGNRIPVGSAFDVLFFADNKMHLVELESPRKDHLFLGSLVEEGLKGLEQFVKTNPFETEHLQLLELHGKFVWEHPITSSPRPSIEELKARINNYSQIFELEKGEAGVINLRYVAVSNYEEENSITGYISRISASEFTESDLAKEDVQTFFSEKIQQRFGKSPEEANAIFTRWFENKFKQETVVQGEGKDAVAIHNDGVIITLRNNHPSYEIEIGNLQPPNAGETLKRVMTGLALILLEKRQVRPETAAVAEATAAVKKVDAEQKKEEIVTETRGVSARDANVGGVDLDFLTFLNDLPEGEGGEEGEEEGEGVEAEPTLGSVSATVATEVNPVTLASRAGASLEEAPLGGGGGGVAAGALESIEIKQDVDKAYITRLKELDLDLFGYQDKRAGKSKGYSSACQTSNGDMPHSLSPSEYARVKEIYKDKITFIEGPKPAGWKLRDPPPKGYGPNVSWDFDKNFTPPRPVWVTLRTGSEIKRNWYLCAKYWCLQDAIPLIESEFEAKQECPFCHGKAIKTKSAGAGETVLLRRTHKGFKKYIGFQSKAKHPDNYPLPCCGIKPKEDKLVDRTRPYNKVAIQPLAEEEETPAGLLLHDEEKKASQTRGIPPPVEINKILSALQTKYIKSAGKYPLGPGELGIVPPQVDTLFGQDSTVAIKKSGPQQMLSREHVAFVRFGLQNTERPGDRFLSMLGFWMGTFDLDRVIAQMTTPAFVHAFEDANYGTLVHEFARPDLPADPPQGLFNKFVQDNAYAQNEELNRPNLVRLYYAYTNFMNYVRDANTPKDIRYFEHLLMMPKVLVSEGILLLRIMRDNDSDEWNIQCPTFGIPDTMDAPKPVFIIHDDKYNVWEPLVFYAGMDKAVVSFDSASLRKLGQITSTSISQWLRQIREKGVACGRKETPAYTWTPIATAADAVPVPTTSQILGFCLRAKIDPRGIVRERSNRFVGFLFQSAANKQFFVPARDDGTSLHAYPRYYESKALLPAPSLSDLAKYYNEQNYFGTEGLKLSKILLADDKAESARYTGVLLQCGLVLPIEPTQETGGLDVQPLSDFPWDLDERLSPLPSTDATAATDVDTAEGFLKEAFEYLRLILANHFKRDADGEQVLANIMTERSKINLPLWEKRRRMDILLQPVVHRFVKESPYSGLLKNLPRIRKNIGNPATIRDDCPTGIASWSETKCLLHTPSEKLMVARLTDEMLRNPWAFAEIEQGKVSRVRPLSGTVETATEILTTDTFGFEGHKTTKNKYAQGLTFAEEQPSTLEILKAVLGGDLEESASLVEQMTRAEAKAYHLELPLSFKGILKLFVGGSALVADERLTFGLVQLFKATKQKEYSLADIHGLVKNILGKLKAPSDVTEGGWRSSPYDFFALSVLNRCQLAMLTTSVTGKVEVKYYFNPNTTNWDHIILFWGDAPDLVVDLQNNPLIPMISIPRELAAALEAVRGTTMIKTVDDLKALPAPQPIVEPAVVIQAEQAEQAEQEDDLLEPPQAVAEPQAAEPQAALEEPAAAFTGVVQEPEVQVAPVEAPVEAPVQVEAEAPVAEEAKIDIPLPPEDAPQLAEAQAEQLEALAANQEAEPSQIQEAQPSPAPPPVAEQQISDQPPHPSNSVVEPETSDYSDEAQPEPAPLPAPRSSAPESADTHSAALNNANS